MLAGIVKEAARSDLPALVEEAGYRPYRGFYYFCAHHKEKSASARLYPNGVYSHCCQEWRDPIGLAQMIQGGTAGEAIRYLVRRYGIHQESPHKRDVHAVQITANDLMSADLIATGLRWLTEDVLAELKRPLSEGGEFDGLLIRKWTKRQQCLSRWDRYQAARTLTRYQRMNPVSARSVAVGPFRQKKLLAYFVNTLQHFEDAA